MNKIDEDDRVYIVYGNSKIHLLELNKELSGPNVGGISRVTADFSDFCYSVHHEY